MKLAMLLFAVTFVAAGAHAESCVSAGQHKNTLVRINENQQRLAIFDAHVAAGWKPTPDETTGADLQKRIAADQTLLLIPVCK